MMKPLITLFLISLCVLSCYFVEAETTLKGGVSQSQPLKADPGVVGFSMDIMQGQHPPIVTDVYPGTPAEEAGLKAYDEIITINQKPTLNMTVAEVDTAISDIPGEMVLLGLRRLGKPLQAKVIVAPRADLKNKQIQSLYRQMQAH
jgi:C-terminal processing protease CtpA/Prc